ncbi:unnamed protein product [Boreogadus saida]
MCFSSYTMKMRRHRVFLLCTVGLCVISFLHYYKALHYVSLLRELSAPYPNIKSFIMVTGFFWREQGMAATPLSPAPPEEAPPLRPHQRPPNAKVHRGAGAAAAGGGGGGGGDGGVGGGRGGVGDELAGAKDAMGGREGMGVVGRAGLEMRLREEPAPPPRPWRRPEQENVGVGDVTSQERADDRLRRWDLGLNPDPPARPEPVAEKLLVEHQAGFPKGGSSDPLETMGDLHTRTYQLKDDRTSYFVRTKAGALCFRQGTEVTLKEEPGNGKAPGGGPPGPGQRRPLEAPQQQQQPAGSASTAGPLRVKPRARGGKRLVKCVCRPGWHGPYCGVPTMVYHSNLPTKERLTPRETPRRVINAINVNHEFDLLHARFHELRQAVDLFLICESNFTAYGERRPLSFLQRLLNGTYDYVRHKIVYVFLDHFPEGGRQDGWIADDYLRTYLTRDGMARVGGVRPDDVFVINDADEIPAHEGLLFLKLFDGWTEPFAIHMRKSLYGFFWKQLGSLEVVSGCTVGMLRQVYDGDGIRLRRREYYTMPGFRRYENDTGHILVQWSVGSPFHFAGWHCSWCFSPHGIHLKLVSAQNGDFPRWGDYEDKRDLSYIKDLIRTGGWFDGSLQEYPSTDPKEHMYAPKYMLEHYEHFGYLLDNPYARSDAAAPAG